MNYLSSIPEALVDIQQGKLLIVVDDEDRENEGDFVTAARNVTPELINFMSMHGRGLICAPLTENRCKELQLNLMIPSDTNTSFLKTPFTVSVDLLGHGCTTGISASDRSKTIQALIDRGIKPSDLGRPGHIFPLQAANGGVLARNGHTEAAIDLARLAGFEPAGALVEIMNPDGSMARLQQLADIANKFHLKIISIKDLISYRLKYDKQNNTFIKKEPLLEKKTSAQFPTKYGNFSITLYTQLSTGAEHLVIQKEAWKNNEPVLVRVHSACFTGDIFGSYRCDCGEQLIHSMQKLETEGKGIIIYLNQEGRNIGLTNKIKAYALQDKGYDTVEANEQLGFDADVRDYKVAAEILKDLGISQIRLLTNNPDKENQLAKYGIDIVERIPLEIPPNSVNNGYLRTKKEKMGHRLENV